MTAFTLVIYEHPQVNLTMPLTLGIEPVEPVEPVERLRVTFAKLTQKHITMINKLSWNLSRKPRKDKGCRRKK